MDDDLEAFIRAQLDKDERIALAAEAGPWTVLPVDYPTDGVQIESATAPVVCTGAEGDGGVCAQEDAEHIARHHPTRTLADVAVMRQLLVLHPNEIWPTADGKGHLFCRTCDVDDGVIGGDGRPCLTLRLLGARYALEPGYREEWRP